MQSAGSYPNLETKDLAKAKCAVEWFNSAATTTEKDLLSSTDETKKGEQRLLVKALNGHVTGALAAAFATALKNKKDVGVKNVPKKLKDKEPLLVNSVEEYKKKLAKTKITSNKSFFTEYRRSLLANQASTL